MDFVFFVRHQQRGVECGVDLPHFRKTELVHDGGENFDNCEWSLSFWNKLEVDNRAFEVSGF